MAVTKQIHSQRVLRCIQKRCIHYVCLCTQQIIHSLSALRSTHLVAGQSDAAVLAADLLAKAAFTLGSVPAQKINF